MDLHTFRKIVDRAAPGIATCEGDLHQIYDYVGLEHGSAHTSGAVSSVLYARIKGKE